MLAGASGAGKSMLALRCIALGAQLISDDITWVSKDLIALGPDALAGRIEIRGIGVLNAPTAPPAPLALVVDMDETASERLPPARTVCIQGQDVDLLHKVETPYFAEAILHYMRHGRHDGA